MITVKRYTPELQVKWDCFVDRSKNGTFMLKRGYVEYHSDRFEDCSLLFFDETDNCIALMPASRHGREVRSHGGLTYGGMICDRRMTAVIMLEVFHAMINHLKAEGVTNLLYKRVPSIYYSYPADEDLYALYRTGAHLVRRDLSTTIDLCDPIPFSSARVRGIKKARKSGLAVRETDDYESYVALLTEVLVAHHNTRPPHTADELRLLATRFPDVVKLFCAFRENEMLAGVLVFKTQQVVHAQYIANSDAGRNIGALDIVMDFLIREYSVGCRYFDFGISTEDSGRVLNTGLVGQKEMFGGRGIAYDFYSIKI